MQFKNLLISLIFILYLNSCAYTQEVVINVNSTQFIGTKKVFDGTKINVFLSIPYAKPPIGDLRFKKPKPIKEYEGSINAKQWPNNCIQNIMPQIYLVLLN